MKLSQIIICQTCVSGAIGNGASLTAAGILPTLIDPSDALRYLCISGAYAARPLDEAHQEQ